MKMNATNKMGDVMNYMSNKEYESRMKKIRYDNISKYRKRKLKEEKNKCRQKIKLPSTSKLILFGAILLCLEIIIFCEYAMIVLGDASAMYALIGVCATLTTTILGYFSKSRAENTANGIVYETAMAKMNNTDNDEAVD